MNTIANSILSPKFFLLTFLLLLLGLFALYGPNRIAYEQDQISALKVKYLYDDQRVYQDLLKIKKALTEYYAVHNKYPKSQGFDGIRTKWGKASKDWIPGLVPDFLKSLPVDPRDSDDGTKQYLYNSSGEDYKLVSMYPAKMKFIQKNHPEMIDPIRPSYSFGFWTPSAKNR